jgi:molybdopterin/thiamine biosynthesis adenylyltransferase
MLSVGIEVEPACGNSASVQHAAAMTINLLCRFEGLVSEIRVAAGKEPIRPRTFPFAPGADTVAEAILATASAIDGVPAIDADPSGAERILRIGPGPAGPWLRLHGEGFCGAIGTGAISSVSSSALPFGPYIAACLAAGEVFRAARLPAERYDPVEALSYSAWDGTLGSGQIHQPGEEGCEVILDFGLAGVGAVGCALMHALWASPGVAGKAIIADNDEKGIEATNLNRCVLFAASDIGSQKASTAARVCADAEIEWKPLDGIYTRSALSWVPEMLVSAVDTNRSRDQLQQGFWPARLLGASTQDLRAELIRCGPPGSGPCLRCFNPPEADIPEDVLREDLRNLSDIELAAFARRIDKPVALVRRWAEEGGCSEVAAAAIGSMRDGQETPKMFAVGFVSVLAGTMLGAELVKEHLAGAPGLDDSHQSAKFQFFRPTVSENGRPKTVQRDAKCPACAEGQPGVDTWRKRFQAWSPPASAVGEVK